MEHLIEKAAGMIEALPYIQRFRNETVVVKFGGSILDDPDACRAILQDVAFLEVVGLRPVVVHGGGKAIDRNMQAQGLRPTRHHGLRVTDADSMKIVEHTLNCEINTHLVKTVMALNCRAVGIHGQDVLAAEKHPGTDPDTGEPVDLGFVGTVTRVDTEPIQAALDAQSAPIITPIGLGAGGELYNVNADDAAAAIARALKARKLVFLSDVPGVLRDTGNGSSIYSTIRTGDVEDMIRNGTLHGGMIPKIRSAVQTIAAGVRKVHLVDSSLRHSLLLELFTEEGVGTEIVAS